MSPIPKHAPCEVTTAGAYCLSFLKKIILFGFSYSALLVSFNRLQRAYMDLSYVPDSFAKLSTRFLNGSPQKCPQKRMGHGPKKTES